MHGLAVAVMIIAALSLRDTCRPRVLHVAGFAQRAFPAEGGGVGDEGWGRWTRDEGRGMRDKERGTQDETRGARYEAPI